MAQNRPFFKVSSSNLLVTFFMIVAFFVVFYYAFKAFAWLAGLLMPIIIIATLIIDYKVVIDYFKWLGKLVKDNPVIGIVAIILSFLGSAFVSVFLLSKAIFKKKMKQITEQRFPNQQQTQEGEFVDFEEVDSDVSRQQRNTAPPQISESLEDDYVDYEELFEDNSDAGTAK